MSTLTATPTTTTLPATMTVRETSRLLGISLRATYRLIEADQLPVIRTGRRIHVITHKLYTMLGIPLDQHAEERVDEDDHGDVPASGRSSR
jgi:excisionase family DNA binding protein